MVALTNLKLVRRSWDAEAGESRRNAKKHILLNIASASVQISLLRSDTWNIGRCFLSSPLSVLLWSNIVQGSFWIYQIPMIYQKDHHIMSISAANGKNQLFQIFIFHIISKRNYFHTLRLSLTQLHWNFVRCQVLAVYESSAQESVPMFSKNLASIILNSNLET